MLTTWPHPPRMRRGEDFLGRDIGVAGDAVLGGRGAALPFMAIGKTDRQIGARAGNNAARGNAGRSASRCRSRNAHCAHPRRDGAS